MGTGNLVTTTQNMNLLTMDQIFDAERLSAEDRHTGAYLGLFIVALGDLVVGDVDEAHLSLLILQLVVKDLRPKRINRAHEKTISNANVLFQGCRMQC